MQLAKRWKMLAAALAAALIATFAMVSPAMADTPTSWGTIGQFWNVRSDLSPTQTTYHANNTAVSWGVPGSSAQNTPAIVTLPNIDQSFDRALLLTALPNGQIAQAVIRVTDNNGFAASQWQVISSHNYGQNFHIDGYVTAAARGNDIRVGGRDVNNNYLVYIGGTISQNSNGATVSYGDWTWQPGFSDRWVMKTEPHLALIHGQYRALYSDDLVYTAGII
ncbi:hypothetical protein HH310_21180 [Actinoplanes sp. TBRC 11911]|uniref:hypothetical protein n=1 Tax=Actinoplanes sp. TBRC 11911 TaxID=2729386 RepID=UPI00145E5921|nr:hypothetical protein [Actinoplanes sp. TBRC 11911]NMO53686.1 hypothetical protein [Actinoplanes sp. TBRC 11911]